MEITFCKPRMEREFNEERRLQAQHGEPQAKKIRVRMTALKAAENLGVFWPPYSKPERCHELTGNRAGQFSMDLMQPYRLIFVPNHNPLPLKEDGQLDWFQISNIKVLEVEDTHE